MPSSRERADHLVDARLVADVDADGRAVEDQHLRRGGEPFRQHHPLLVAARERLRRRHRRPRRGCSAARSSAARARGGAPARPGRGDRSGGRGR